jgi:hypothetical protein
VKGGVFVILAGVSVCRQPPLVTAETGSNFLRASIIGLQHALVAFVTILIVPTRLASVGRFEVACQCPECGLPVSYHVS